METKLFRSLMAFVIGFFCLLVPISSFAYDKVIDGIYYFLDNSAKVASVTYSNYDKYSGEVNIPATITYSGSIYNVTSIGPSVFSGSTGLTSVTIPNSVSFTSIGNNAFSGCTNLTSVTIPGTVTRIADYTFQNCKKLTSVYIPNSVTSIGKSAFEGCTSLATVKIPNSVTSIEASAFYGCTGLTSMTIPNNVIK